MQTNELIEKRDNAAKVLEEAALRAMLMIRDGRKMLRTPGFGVPDAMDSFALARTYLAKALKEVGGRV